MQGGAASMKKQSRIYWEKSIVDEDKLCVVDVKLQWLNESSQAKKVEDRNYTPYRCFDIELLGAVPPITTKTKDENPNEVEKEDEEGFSRGAKIRKNKRNKFVRKE